MREDVAAWLTFTVAVPPTLRFSGTVVTVPLVPRREKDHFTS